MYLYSRQLCIFFFFETWLQNLNAETNVWATLIKNCNSKQGLQVWLAVKLAQWSDRISRKFISGYPSHPVTFPFKCTTLKGKMIWERCYSFPLMQLHCKEKWLTYCQSGNIGKNIPETREKHVYCIGSLHYWTINLITIPYFCRTSFDSKCCTVCYILI